MMQILKLGRIAIRQDDVVVGATLLVVAFGCAYYDHSDRLVLHMLGYLSTMIAGLAIAAGAIWFVAVGLGLAISNGRRLLGRSGTDAR